MAFLEGSLQQTFYYIYIYISISSPPLNTLKHKDQDAFLDLPIAL